MILLACITVLTLSGLYALNVHTTVTNTVKEKCTKFRILNKLAASRYSNYCAIFYVSVKLIWQATWYSFLQYINNSIKKIDKKRYEINYVVEGKLYKMVIKPKRGPCSILLVLDENDNEVNKKVIPFLGPEENFHGSILTPSFFGFKSLTFEMFDGRSLSFGEQDVLTLS